jgi:hypothetical protein
LIDVLDDAGHVKERRRPPRYYKLSYLVTAWTQRPEDEHRLLTAVLLCLLRYDHLPLDVLTERLAELRLPVPVTVALPPPEDRALSDVWSALGGELKPSLDLVVISPFQAGSVDEVRSLVREGLRLNLGISDHRDDETGSENKATRRGAKKDPIRKGGRTVGTASQGDGEETIVAGTRDERGRVFHLRDITYRPSGGGE